MLPLLYGGPVEKGKEIEWCFKHALDGPQDAFLTKFKVMILLAAGLIMLVAYFASKRMSWVPQGLGRNALESIVLLIRDTMVRPTMGHHGDKLVPFFCTVFVFIITMNYLGMIPIPIIGGTATSNLMVTGAMASIVLFVSVASGFVLHGPKGFVQLFIPHGLPIALAPLLFVLEFIGMFIKHGVLMVRLFANMIAGHLVIGAFLGLIFTFGLPALPALLLALVVLTLELLVAFLQAYVFTLLSTLFVGAMVHPEH
ncbi:MAG TPA: F0F1 ATP synthase subunit A [Planctomycetota bacterium]|jgi:F-type H+-transporting ATPase subunit a|nr:F0F1 ATP synthase subunit A [Planctomycetota bacterium]